MTLRAYFNHPKSWADLLGEVKSNMNVSSPAARVVYTDFNLKQLRNRMSGKLSTLLKMRQEDIVVCRHLNLNTYCFVLNITVEKIEERSVPGRLKSGLEVGEFEPRLCRVVSVDKLLILHMCNTLSR